MEQLTRSQVARYRRDGFLVIRGVFAGSELERLRAAAARVVDAGEAHGRELDREGVELRVSEDHGFADGAMQLDERLFFYARGPRGERVFRRAERLWQRDPSFRTATVHPLVLDAVAAILDSAFAPANDSLVVKMPGAGAAVPWHRDPTGKELISEVGDATGDFTCDIYLDASTRDNGCLWAIPGSHRGEPETMADPLDFAVADAVPVEAQPGDLVLHSTGLLHGSPQNSSGGLRRTVYLHFRTLEHLRRHWSQTSIDEHRRYLERFTEERAAAGLPVRTAGPRRRDESTT